MEVKTKFEIGDIFYGYKKYEKNVVYSSDKARKDYAKRVKETDLDDYEARNSILDEYLYTSEIEIYIRQVRGFKIGDDSKMYYTDNYDNEWEEENMLHNVPDLMKVLENTFLTEEKHAKELLKKFL